MLPIIDGLAASERTGIDRHELWVLELARSASARAGVSAAPFGRLGPFSLDTTGEAVDVDDSSPVQTSGDQLDAVVGFDLERDDRTDGVNHIGHER